MLQIILHHILACLLLAKKLRNHEKNNTVLEQTLNTLDEDE